MPSLTSDEMARGRYRAARAKKWRGIVSLQEVAKLLAEGERLLGQSKPRADWFDGRLANEVGFWRRVRGTSWYREPPRSVCQDEPDNKEKAWKLVELRFLVRHEAVEFGLSPRE